jgi:hypothetical protein
VTPFVVESEYPDADDRPVPWWWAENHDDLRLREEKMLEQREVFRLETVDHGQVVKYLGDRPVETAKNGLMRGGSHSRYGFGELRLKPLDEQYQES